MTTWVVQQNLINDNDLHHLKEFLTELKISHILVDIIPFSNEIECPPLNTDRVIPYGSTKMMKIANHHNWKGMFFDSKNFRVDAWNANRNDMLNQDAEIVTIDEIAKHYEECDPDAVVFIRPNEDLKAFNGTVTTVKEVSRWMSSIDAGNFQIDKTTLVAVAKPKNIQMEWRYFIVGGKIISGSHYRIHGQRLVKRETDKAVLDEAQQLANKWLPHETCVMDTALTIDGLKVVEFNCFNSSGFYYHDIKGIITAATEYVDKLP